MDKNASLSISPLSYRGTLLIILSQHIQLGKKKEHNKLTKTFTIFYFYFIDRSISHCSSTNNLFNFYYRLRTIFLQDMNHSRCFIKVLLVKGFLKIERKFEKNREFYSIKDKDAFLMQLGDFIYCRIIHTFPSRGKKGHWSLQCWKEKYI